MTGKGVNRLARAIDARTIKKTAAPSTMDFGVIDEEGNLRLDQFGPPIPRSDYLVAEWMLDVTIPLLSRVVRMASPVTSEGEDTPGTTLSPPTRIDFAGGKDSGHVPHVNLRFAPELQPGDRVLVLWVRSDPVIISKVVTAGA